MCREMRGSWMWAAFSLLLAGQVLAQDKWVNIPGAAWEDAEGKKFKIDNCVLMVSNDGTQWNTSDDNRWKDRSGATYRFQDQKVEQSMDGSNWKEFNQWEDAKGQQFSLGNGCLLYSLQV